MDGLIWHAARVGRNGGRLVTLGNANVNVDVEVHAIVHVEVSVGANLNVDADVDVDVGVKGDHVRRLSVELKGIASKGVHKLNGREEAMQAGRQLNPVGR